ncbi:MAG: helix-turn-helix domain-containing protein [Candidatus Saccharibacteria bacterium]
MPHVNFIETSPANNLAEYVEAFWHCQITETGVLRLMPTASCDLMIHSSSEDMKVVLIGPMMTAQTTLLRPGDLFIGARFRPGCRVTLTKESFALLRDSKVSDFSKELVQLGYFEKSIQGDTYTVILSKLPHLIEACIKEGVITRDPIVDMFLDQVEERSDMQKIADILENLPISSRQFRRRFKQFTCLTPKEFLRLHRQKYATEDIKQSGMTITNIASLHGYADHAHFSHEFQSLVGVSPSDLEKELTLK